VARKKAAIPPHPVSPIHGKRFWLDRAVQYGGPGGLARWIRGRGGVLVGDVDASLDYFVLAEARRAEPGKSLPERKVAKLAGAKITSLYENEMPALLLPSREEALVVLAGGAANSEVWQGMLPPRESPLQIDLAGADLSGLELTDFALRNCDLDGVRFDDTNLDESAIDHPKNVDFRTIRLPAGMYIDVPQGCNFRGMTLGEIHIRNPVACDLSEASLMGLSLRGWETTDLTAERVNFHQAHMEGSQFTRAKLTQAIFTQAGLSQAVFDNADLREANCEGANLRGASLKNTDLRRANFRNANLGDADLTGAKITGADFTGANLRNVKGLPASRTAKVSPGTHLLRLEAGLMDVADWQLHFALALSPSGRAEVELQRRQQWEHGHLAQHLHRESYMAGTFATDLLDALGGLAREHAGAVPLLGTVRVMPESLTPQLGALPLLGLAEVFGQPIATAEQAIEARHREQERAAQARRDIIAGLRQWAAGVERWNQLDDLERRALGDLKKIDLSRCWLVGLKLKQVNCAEANFEGANLSQANLVCTTLRKANLKGADLSQVKANSAGLTGANLEGATLRGGQFSYARFQKANLNAADLTGAILTRAEYDAGTTFPAGFDPRAAGMVLRTPRVKKPAAAAPPPPTTDFAAFFAKLPTVADTGRIRNAVSMLRAEKFQLFAETADEHVLGVVRSQSSDQRVYACRLSSSGQFECGTQNLRVCGGLSGAVCKHLLVLILGLAKSGKLDSGRAFEWLQRAQRQRPTFDKEAMTATFLKYKTAETGEIDWRPTETIPEDYYAL
jgi:uncharacterized protein YjbI with pentapeptide repeats